ncbi:MAG: type II CAAX endopeptidase family protein [Lentisphaerota bacterium]
MNPIFLPWHIAQAASADQSSLPTEWGGHLWMAGLVYLGLALAGLIVSLLLAGYWHTHPRRLGESLDRIRQRAWPLHEALQLGITLLALFAMVLSAHMITEALSIKGLGQDERLWIIIQSVTFHWAGLILILRYIKRQGTSLKASFGLTRENMLVLACWGLVFYLATMPFLWFYTILYQTGLKLLGYESTLQSVAVIFTDEQPMWLRVYFMVMGTVLAPCFEELLFRGIALPILLRKWGAVPAILAVSMAFAVIHFHVPSLVPLFIISVAFSLSYLYTESILTPIIMHALFNAVNLGMMTGLRQACL